MTAIPDDELLSAYLDGELTAGEVARVERLLAERPESRQLLEELRLVRESLQALPRRRLDDAFSQHVLRQAEREVLHGGADVDPIAERAGQGDLLTAGHATARSEWSDSDSSHEKPSNGEPSSIAQSPSQTFDWQRMRRPAAWAAMALAAGLLIMFLSPQHKQAGNQQVAHRAAPRGEAAPPADKDRGMQEKLAEWRASPAGEPSAAGEPLSAASGARSSGAERQPSADDTSKLQKQSLDQNTVRNGSGFGPPTSAPAGPQSERFMRRAAREQTPPVDATTLNLADDSDQAALGFGRSTPAIDDQTLIVWCEVAPEVDFRRDFDKLLADQQIEWQDSGDVAADSDEKMSDGPVSGLQRSTRRRQSRVYFAESASKSAGVDPQRLAETLERRAEQESESVARQPPLDALREPATELVLVEASEQQIKAMLAGLDQTPETYPAVRVEPAAGEPRQQSLKRFERGDLSVRGRASRSLVNAKQSTQQFRASDKLGASANEEQDAAIRAGAEIKSRAKGATKKEQRSSDYGHRAPGRAKRVLLQRAPTLLNDIADGEKVEDKNLDDKKLDDDAKFESKDDAEADSAPGTTPPPAPAASAATNPAPSPAPPPAPAARGVKPGDKTVGDDAGSSEQPASGQETSLMGRKLATQKSPEKGAAERESGEVSARSGPRVYRVLFVFHPQSAGDPAEAAKAQPSEPETPEE